MEYMESTYDDFDDFDDDFFPDLFEYDPPDIDNGLADGQKWISRCGEVITLKSEVGEQTEWFVGLPGGMVYSNTEEFGLKVLGAHADDDYDLITLVE